MVQSTDMRHARDHAGSLCTAPEWCVLTQGEVLTPMESRVLVEIARGHGLRHVAETLRIGPATAHLQSIFIKTGTKKQAELVRLFSDQTVLIPQFQAKRTSAVWVDPMIYRILVYHPGGVWRLLAELPTGLQAPNISNRRARFYFTERGWQKTGRLVTIPEP